MIEKLIPLGKNIWVELVEESEKTSGGIIIPDSAKEQTQRSRVLSVGDEVKVLKSGDQIFFKKYSGTKMDKKHLVLEEKDVLGIIKK